MKARLDALRFARRFAVVVAVAGARAAHPQDSVPVRSLLEEVRLGGSPAQALGQINAIRPLANGMVAVLFARTTGFDLRVFGPDGQAVWSHAFRRGESPSALATRADTIAVQVRTDDGSEIQFFTAGGRQARRARPVSNPSGVDLLGSISGPWILRRETTQTIENGLPQALLIVPFELSLLDGASDNAVIARVTDSAARIAVSMMGRGTQAVGLPWHVRFSFAAASGRVFHAAGPEYRIAVFNVDGTRNGQITRSVPRLQITAEDRERWLVEVQTSGRWSAGTVDRLRSLKEAGFRPVISGLFASPDGALAVVRRDLSVHPSATNAPQRIEILDPTGVVRGQVTLRAGARLHAFDGRCLYVAEVDSTQATDAITDRQRSPFVHAVRYRIATPR